VFEPFVSRESTPIVQRSIDGRVVVRHRFVDGGTWNARATAIRSAEAGPLLSAGTDPSTGFIAAANSVYSTERSWTISDTDANSEQISRCIAAINAVAPGYPFRGAESDWPIAGSC
jgi:hypothetical protein